MSGELVQLTSHPRFVPAELIDTKALMTYWKIKSPNTITAYIKDGMPVQGGLGKNLFNLAACEEWRRNRPKRKAS